MKRLLAYLSCIFLCLPQLQATAGDSIYSTPNLDCAGIAGSEPWDLVPYGGKITDFMASALAWNDWTLVRMLIWMRADPEWVRGSQFYEAALREIPNVELVEAATAGDDDRVLATIEAGADVNVKPNVGEFMPPLIRAAACDHVSTVELLIAHGADVNIAASADSGGRGAIEGHTALIAAAHYANDEIVEILLERGANVNAREYTIHDVEAPERLPWDTPLLAAGSMRTAEILLAHGADPNALKWNGTSALMEVASGARYEWCKLLLTHGADPKPIDIYGHTAAELARKAFDGEMGARTADLIENWGAGDQKPSSRGSPARLSK
jgi:ankyrin repeat protein